MRNNKPKGRSAKQVKADEDFARRMQQQEKELANFRVLEYQEMLRRRKAVEDMGGVAEQARHLSLRHMSGIVSPFMHSRRLSHSHKQAAR